MFRTVLHGILHKTASLPCPTLAEKGGAMMRECMICGAHKPVLSCEKIQLCHRCAEVLWMVLLPKIHPERVQREAAEENSKNNLK